MKSFGEWVAAAHPDVIEENWWKNVGAATAAGDPHAVSALVVLVAVVPGVLILAGGLVILAFGRSGVE